MSTFTSPYSLMAALGAVIITVIGRVALRRRMAPQSSGLVPSVLCGLTLWLLLSCAAIAALDGEFYFADSFIDEFALLLFHSDWTLVAMLIAVIAICIYRKRLLPQKQRLIGPAFIAAAVWVVIDRSYLFWLATGRDDPLWHDRSWSEGFEGSLGPILVAAVIPPVVLLFVVYGLSRLTAGSDSATAAASPASISSQTSGVADDTISPVWKRRTLAGYLVAIAAMLCGLELLGAGRSSGGGSHLETTYVNYVRTSSRIVRSSRVRKQPGELYIYALGGLLLGIGLVAPFPQKDVGNSSASAV